MTDGPVGPLAGHVVTSVFWSMVRAWGGRLLSTIVFVILARLVAPADFGLIALAGVFVDMIRVLQDQGLGQALVQRAKVTRTQVNSVFWFTVVAAGGLATALCATAGVWSAQFGTPRLREVLYALAAAVVLSGLEGVPRALLARSMRFRALAVRDLAANGLAGITGIALAFAGFGAWALVGQTVANAAIGCGWLWLATGWRPSLVFRWRDVIDLLPTSLAIFGIAAMNFAMTRIDDLLVAGYLGTIALGFYDIAYSFYTLTTSATVGAAGAVCLPAFSRLQHDPARLRRAVLRAVEASSIFGGCFFGALAVGSLAVVTSLFGARWAPSSSAASALLLLGPWQGVWFVLAWAVVATGHSRRVLVISVLSGTSSVVAFYVAVHWGYTAVAIAFTARAYLITAPAALIMASRALQLPVRAILRATLRGWFATAVTVGPLLALRFFWVPSARNHWTWLASASGIWLAALLITMKRTTNPMIGDVMTLLRASRTSKPAPS